MSTPLKLPTAMKVSEPVVSRMLARLLRVNAEGESVTAVCDAYFAAHDEGSTSMVDVLWDVCGIYPWGSDVLADIMNEKPSGLMQHLLTFEQKSYIAKDRTLSGSDSLWLVAAAPSQRMLKATRSCQCCGVFRTLKIDGEMVTVLAVQLSSITQ